MIIIISGASGSGKTTILKAIELKLPKNNISINYFDDIGIPSHETMLKEYGSGGKWQKAMLGKWFEKLSKIEDKQYIFLEGSFYPEYALPFIKDKYILICIHAEREKREKRLISERKQPELANQDMENYAQVLKNRTLELGGMVIDSTNKDANYVADEIINIINDIE